MRINVPFEIDSKRAFSILAETLNMPCVLDDDPGYETRWDEDLEQRVLYYHDELIDERGALYDALMILANQIFPNLDCRDRYDIEREVL